ncbi:EF-hand domain-containing protein [Streptomyces sp. NPDC057638]|uniref:EF-hand domain-containing protein n=1 Tax=Streptomyces sp. NPDC057638 TaxID=3346190 RepID=UPI0036803BC4
MDRLLTNKIDWSYLHIDIDRNGLIERQDLLGLASQVLLTFSEPSSTPKGQALMGAFDRFWDTLAAHCDTDRDGRITPAEYRTGMLAAFVDGDLFDQIFQPAAEALAVIADTDGDGTIDRSEFQAMEAVLGVAENQSHIAFDRLDTDANGTLEVSEYLAAVRGYYTSDDPDAPGNWLYGATFRFPLAPPER